MKATTNSTFKQDVLESKKAVLLDIWASWCGPCRGMEPIVEAVGEETKDWAEVYKLSTETDMELAQALGVNSLPTFLVYKDGKIVGSTIGATSKVNLLELLEKAK